jgi:hypothetical protein
MFSWLRRLVAAVRAWWRPRRRLSAYSGVASLDATTDPAPAVSSGRLVLVGTPERAKWLRFTCPCGCGEVLALNLMPTHHPRWTIDRHGDGTLTVSPSVDATACGSHFWIRRNRVEWA